MDIALGLWLYDPEAEYRLTHSQASKISDVLEWRSAYVLPTEEELGLLLVNYNSTNPPTLTQEERIRSLEDEVVVLKEDIKKLKEKP